MNCPLLRKPREAEPLVSRAEVQGEGRKNKPWLYPGVNLENDTNGAVADN